MSYKIKKQKAKDYSNIEIDKIFDDIVKQLNIKDYKRKKGGNNKCDT